MTTGGTRKELQQLIDVSKELKVKVRKKFNLEDVKEAIYRHCSQERGQNPFEYNLTFEYNLKDNYEIQLPLT
jgi:hypothetical protein